MNSSALVFSRLIRSLCASGATSGIPASPNRELNCSTRPDVTGPITAKTDGSAASFSACSCATAL